MDIKIISLLQAGVKVGYIFLNLCKYSYPARHLFVGKFLYIAHISQYNGILICEYILSTCFKSWVLFVKIYV